MPSRFWSALLVGLLLLLALLRGPEIARALPTAKELDGESLVAAWAPDRECEPTSLMDEQLSAWSLPAANDDYLLGLEALSSGESEVARDHLSRAAEAEDHVLALALLANMQLQAGESLPEVVSEIGSVNGERAEETRFELAGYYLGIAARCDVLGEAPAAQHYLAAGEAFLPPGGISELDLHLARRIGEMYLAGDQLNEALPWLRHASQANDSALLLLADALDRLGSQQEALALYQRALLYYPNRAENRVAGARVAADLGETELAITMLSGMPRWEDLGPAGLLLWAELCERQADTACAVLQYERVLSLEPDNQIAQSRLQVLSSEQ